MSITQEKIALAIIKGHINSLDQEHQKRIQEAVEDIREIVFDHNYNAINYGSLALALVSAEYAAEGVEGE